MNKKVALIADTHFGLRGNSPYFIEAQRAFFQNVFFPTIDQEKIDTIIHLGDVYDKRSSINFATYDNTMSFFFDEIEKRNLTMHVIVGNHDVPYRNTNYPNAPKLLLKKNNYIVHSDPEHVTIKGNELLFLPWVNVENTVQTQNLIDNSNSRYIFGHLEIIGSQMQKGRLADHGFDPKTLSKFDKVFSGHFHIRATTNNIWYLGNPYDTEWSDYENSKGFHILDFKDHSLRFIENPKTSHILVDVLENVTESNLAGKIVKIDLTQMEDKDIESVYKLIDSFENRPQSLLYINKSNFTEFATANTSDLGVVTTKDIMIQYVESMEDEKKKYAELKTYLVDLYEKAVELS